MKIFFKNYKYLFLTLLISVIANFRWVSVSIFAYCDYTFQFFNTLVEIPDFGIWSPYGLGSLNLLPWRLAGQNNLIFGLFGALGFNSNVADKLLIMWPWVILSGVVSFFLVRKMTKSDVGGLIGSFVFCFNTYFLAINRAGHLLLSISSVWAVFSLLFFIKTLEEKKIYLAILTALSLFITAAYDFRNLYITIWILLLYFLFFLFIKKEKLNNINSISTAIFSLLPMIILSSLSIFWVVPSFQSGFFSENLLLSRDLFGSSFYHITRALTMFHPFWTGGAIEWFIVQKIPFYFWLTPILVFLGLILNRKNKNILFFAAISLLGIFLAKQAGDPLRNTYQTLFENLPGFNAFREASKFYLLIAIGNSVLIGSFVAWLWQNWNQIKWQIYGKYILAITISLFFLWNVKPLITGEIGSMFIPRQIPNDYKIYKDFILKQDGFFRTLWTPNNSRWTLYTNEKPLLSAVNVINNEWKKYTTLIPNYKDLAINEQIMGIIKIPGAKELYNYSSIKYIVVPTDDSANDTDPFYYYGRQKNPDIRNWYISELDKVKWLKKINIGTKELVIYENTDYKPYFFTLNTIYNLDYPGDLNQGFNFISNQLNGDLNFILSDSGAKQDVKPLSLLKNLYAKIGDKNIKKDLSIIQDSIMIGNQNNSNSLFVNQIKTDVYYSLTNKKLELYTGSNGILSVNKEIETNNNVNIFYQKQLGLSKYYLSIENNLIPVEAKESQRIYLSEPTKQIELYSTGANMIGNPSFEQGLWQQKVGDCNKYDDNGLLAMSLNNQEKTDGKNSLQLEATRHIACVLQKFKVEPNNNYTFSFDYHGSTSKTAGFYMQFNDPDKTVVSDIQNISDDQWHNFLIKIKTPAGAAQATLYIYAYASDNQTNNIVRYDNFSFARLWLENKIQIPSPDKNFAETALKLNEGENIFEFKDNHYNYQNILNNGSFENGLWSAKVGDCHNYDKNPIIAMSLDNKQKSAGNYSLKLSAQKHIACTSVSTPITSNAIYLLSFDYQSDNAYKAGYYLSFNDGSKSNINEVLLISDSKWHTLEKMIKIPNGADNLSLYIYAYASDNKKNNIVRYDNFKLIQIPNLTNEFYLVSKPEKMLKEPSKIDFNLASPTKKIVHIKGVTTPFFLIMSEGYHNQWRLELNNGKIAGLFSSWWPFAKSDSVSDEFHYKLNDFLNVWYINPDELCKNNNSACKKNSDGSYDLEMVVEFWPQRWFYLGLIISGLTLLSCLLYLIYYFVNKYGPRNKN